MSQFPHHHYYERKRRAKVNTAKNAHSAVVVSSSHTKLIDAFVVSTSVITPLLTLPQLWQIWSQHSARGVSLITWATYLGGTATWMIYGFLHREKPIILSYCLLFVVDLLIVVSIFIFR